MIALKLEKIGGEQETHQLEGKYFEASLIARR
jgi:hypothetical protein